jgi:hypothetical protein
VFCWENVKNNLLLNPQGLGNSGASPFFFDVELILHYPIAESIQSGQFGLLAKVIIYISKMHATWDIGYRELRVQMEFHTVEKNR